MTNGLQHLEHHRLELELCCGDLWQDSAITYSGRIKNNIVPDVTGPIIRNTDKSFSAMTGNFSSSSESTGICVGSPKSATLAATGTPGVSLASLFLLRALSVLLGSGYPLQNKRKDLCIQ